jgi:hypothetical protein
MEFSAVKTQTASSSRTVRRASRAWRRLYRSRDEFHKHRGNAPRVDVRPARRARLMMLVG